MNVVHNLRSNHAELIEKEIGEGYKIYTPHWEDTAKQSEFLNTLLKDVEGTITLKVNDNSWFDHDITVEYNGHTFDIRRTYKGIFKAYDPDMNTIIAKIPYGVVYDVEPLKNYTFDKLTTSKVLKVLDYEIAYYEWAKIQVSEAIDINQNRVNDGIAMLERIADAIHTELKHSDDGYSSEYYVNTPFGVASVKHNKSKEYVDINSVTYNIIDFLNMMNK